MKSKRFLTTWALVALAGLLVGLTAGDGVHSATPEVPAIDDFRFDYDHQGQFVVSWTGQFNPGEQGTFTLTGKAGPLVCRGILNGTDCDCHLEEDEEGFWIGCYFDSADPFMVRPCECLTALWWEDDTGFHGLTSFAGPCKQRTLLPMVAR